MTFNLPHIVLTAMVFFSAIPLLAESGSDLVEVRQIDPTIQVDLKYAAADNLTGRVLYPKHFTALLRRAVALDLKKAQDALRPMGLGLKIWDAYRPMETQKALFEVIHDPRYVANPGVMSMHNRGVAVDVTLVDGEGNEVEMPTKFDTMGSQATYFYSGKNPFVMRRLITLQSVMSDAGFYACRTEWWHFFSRRWKDFPNVSQAPGEPNGKK